MISWFRDVMGTEAYTKFVELGGSAKTTVRLISEVVFASWTKLEECQRFACRYARSLPMSLVVGRVSTRRTAPTSVGATEENLVVLLLPWGFHAI